MISAGIDGELSEDELSELRKHLTFCHDCRESARMMANVVSLLNETEDEEVPESLTADIMKGTRTKKKFFRPSIVAAAAAVVIVIAAAGITVPKLLKSEKVYTKSAVSASVSAASDSSAEEDYMNAGDSVVLYSSASEEGSDAEDAMPMIPYSGPFSAVGVIYGPMPDILDEYESEQGSEGETYVFVPTGDFYDIESETQMTTYSEGTNIEPDADTALVIIYG